MGLRPAKITPPRTPVAIPRPRLWTRLDEARRTGGAVWISGPPGSGKTTLVASWLAARRHPTAWIRLDATDGDLGTFLRSVGDAILALGRRAFRPPEASQGLEPEGQARRLLRALLPHLPRGAVLVLDDLAEVPERSPTIVALRVLLEDLPPDATVVFSSRGDPPRAIVPPRAERSLSRMGAADLALAPQECGAIARKRGYGIPKGRDAALHEAAHGWAAGLVLLLGSGTAPGGPIASAATFDYFAGEIFDRAAPEARMVMLEAALLETPTASLVAHATGRATAPRILSGLARRGLFTSSKGSENPAYEFHDLFRSFLLARGRSELPPGRAAEVRRRAAHALRERGGAAAEAAFDLLADAGALDEAADVLRRSAPELLAAGRGGRVRAWLARIPDGLRESDPWLAYLDAITSLGHDAHGARGKLERTAAAFGGLGDATGAWLCWAAQVEAILVDGSDFTPLARCVRELDELRARLPAPSPEAGVHAAIATLAALVHHAPGHPALPEAAAAARAIALGPGPDRLRLTAGAWYHLHAAWWLGDAEGVEPVVRALAPVARAPTVDPVVAIFWLALEAPFHLLCGDTVAADRTAEEARALARRAGVRAWDGLLLTQEIWGACMRGDIEAARLGASRFRSAMRPGALTDLSMLRAFEAAIAIREGALDGALSAASEAKELGERAGSPVVHVFADLALARAAVGLGRGETAAGAIGSARAKLEGIGSPPLSHVLALVEADAALRAGREQDALAAMTRAVPGARAGGLHASYLFSREELARLWALALRGGVARDRVRDLVRVRGLPPPLDAACEEWPWPVRIRALGPFEVEREGRILTAGPRIPRRPLELLRVLVALGGREVSEGALADVLWPGSEGDAAQHALETTLYRLRRLVGPEVVVQRDRRLSLAPDRCWVDAFALSALLESSLAGLQRPGAAPLDPPLAERVSALYRGPLLEADRDAPWAASARERLRRKLARWLDAASSSIGRGGTAALRSRLAEADPALARPSALRIA